MNICQDHWDRLRTAIQDRGLGALISDGGEAAARNFASELTEGRTIDNYDPLMAAFFAVAANAMDAISRAGGNPLYLMGEGPEDPVDTNVYGIEHAGRTWPRCALCYVGLVHELTCTGDGCTLPKVDGCAWMIDRAADDQVEAWKAMQP